MKGQISRKIWYSRKEFFLYPLGLVYYKVKAVHALRKIIASIPKYQKHYMIFCISLFIASVVYLPNAIIPAASNSDEHKLYWDWQGNPRPCCNDNAYDSIFEKHIGRGVGSYLKNIITSVVNNIEDTKWVRISAIFLIAVGITLFSLIFSRLGMRQEASLPAAVGTFMLPLFQLGVAWPTGTVYFILTGIVAVSGGWMLIHALNAPTLPRRSVRFGFGVVMIFISAYSYQTTAMLSLVPGVVQLLFSDKKDYFRSRLCFFVNFFGTFFALCIYWLFHRFIYLPYFFFEKYPFFKNKAFHDKRAMLFESDSPLSFFDLLTEKILPGSLEIICHALLNAASFWYSYYSDFLAFMFVVTMVLAIGFRAKSSGWKLQAIYYGIERFIFIAVSTVATTAPILASTAPITAAHTTRLIGPMSTVLWLTLVWACLTLSSSLKIAKRVLYGIVGVACLLAQFQTVSIAMYSVAVQNYITGHLSSKITNGNMTIRRIHVIGERGNHTPFFNLPRTYQVMDSNLGVKQGGVYEFSQASEITEMFLAMLSAKIGYQNPIDMWSGPVLFQHTENQSFISCPNDLVIDLGQINRAPGSGINKRERRKTHMKITKVDPAEVPALNTNWHVVDGKFLEDSSMHNLTASFVYTPSGGDMKATIERSVDWGQLRKLAVGVEAYMFLPTNAETVEVAILNKISGRRHTLSKKVIPNSWNRLDVVFGMLAPANLLEVKISVLLSTNEKISPIGFAGGEINLLPYFSNGSLITHREIRAKPYLPKSIRSESTFCNIFDGKMETTWKVGNGKEYSILFELPSKKASLKSVSMTFDSRSENLPNAWNVHGYDRDSSRWFRIGSGEIKPENISKGKLTEIFSPPKQSEVYRMQYLFNGNDASKTVPEILLNWNWEN